MSSNRFESFDASGNLKKSITLSDSPIYTSYLINDVSNSTTTPAEIVAMSITLQPGTYAFQYYVRFQAAATTTGIRLSVNFTGTVTAFVANWHFGDASGLGATAAANQTVSGTQTFSAFAARAKSTAGWGTSVSVDAANSDTLARIDGVMVVTVAGDIELYHGSEVAAASTIKTGSCLVVFKTA